MYIETRFFDDGKAQAKLHKGFAYPKLDADRETCDFYLDTINPHLGEKVQTPRCINGETANDSNNYDFDSIEEWIEEMCVEIDDIVPLLIALDSGEWVDITPYV